ncbi:unnamed protein product [Ambrosiozyma monospora]|uniref:Unnamed protein product n=1 Tax=Ambrosiozyma monospora TaxID=43982 RepID=A0ACB5T076_AMBMO|nr:unnamed protein product [Ambrosiozyma monospora]
MNLKFNTIKITILYSTLTNIIIRYSPLIICPLQLFTLIFTIPQIASQEYEHREDGVSPTAIALISLSSFTLIMNILGHFLDNFILHLVFSFFSLCVFITATVHTSYSLNVVSDKDWVCWMSLGTLFASLAACLMNILRLQQARAKCLQGIRRPARLRIIQAIESIPTFSQLLKKLIIYVQAICSLLLITNIVLDNYENYRTMGFAAFTYAKLSILSTLLTKFIKHPALEFYSGFILFGALSLTATYIGLLLRQTVDYSETFLVWESPVFRAFKWSLVPVTVLLLGTFILQLFIVEVALQNYYIPDDDLDSSSDEDGKNLQGTTCGYQGLETSSDSQSVSTQPSMELQMLRTFMH